MKDNTNSSGQSLLSGQNSVNGFEQDRYITSYFVNPVNPGVQVSAPISLKKAAKINSMENRRSRRAPPKIKTRLSAKEKARNRAVLLKEEYPTMQNIPSSLTATARANLVAKHTTNQPKPERSANRKATRYFSSAAAQKNRRASPEVSSARRAEIQRNLGGISPDDPITID